MSPDRQQALDYLRPPADGLWRWAENGTVLVWHDGSTLAFREEVLHILEWLAPNGLPPFGAIVFLLAACRGKIPTVTDIIPESRQALPTALGSKAALLQTARAQLKTQLEAALVQLGTVSRLPGELNSGLKAKCVLAEAVFEPARAERQVEPHAILCGLRELLSQPDPIAPEPTGAGGNYVRQIHIVAEGLKLHTPESLALRLRTGLDALPKEVDPNLPAAERARRLIEELSRDREFGVVARAARELMAAVRLPRRLAGLEQLALGGVSDITNRGPLDRLLLSELAHDDLTLSVRVALNEALYLRREPPMQEPPGTLALLLDSGVRLWGVPRVLASAVALALIARDKQHSEVLVWRAHQKQLQPVDLLSRHGLTQHLGALETAAHPGAAVPAFAEALPPGAQTQSVLVTHRDAFEDPGFRRALAENPAAPGFVATVDREGRFELHVLPLAHRPPLCAAQLDLGALFDQPVGVPPIRTGADTNLPAIFGLSPFPFLLPLAGKVDFWLRADDGFTYAVLNDRRLVQFRDHHAGARVLASDLSGGRTIWMDCFDGTLHVVKAGLVQRPARLFSLPLPGGELRVMDLAAGAELQAVHRYGDVILLIGERDVRAHALTDGRSLGRALNPHRWLNGRFFRGQSHFYAAVWDGTSVKLAPVTLPKDSIDNIGGIFDREDHEGPWVFQTKDGDLISTASGEKIRLAMPTGYPPSHFTLTTSRDGHRLYLAMPETKWDGLYDLRTGGHIKNPKLHSPAKALHAPPPMPVWNLFRVVDSIARLPDGLALCGRKNRWRKLGLDSGGKLCISELADRNPTFADKASFGEPKSTRHGCTLQVAELPGGHQVFLDSRGLLHCQSSDPAVPEVSLVLSSTEVAGWTSDGCVCGPQFFFETQPYTSEPAKVLERLMRILVGL